MGKGSSQWVEVPNLGDVTGLQELIDRIPFDNISNSINSLVEILQIIQALLDVLSVIVEGATDIRKAAFEAAVKALEIAKDEIVELLRRFLAFGLYVLPQVEAFDFQKVIRNEILAENVAPQFSDRFNRVPNQDNPNQTHFELDRLQGRTRPTDYSQFIADVVGSFDDPNDPLRPVFDTSEKISGLAVVAASNDLATFLVAYLLIVFFISDDQEVMGKADRLVRILRIAIGEQEYLGRQFDDNKKNRIKLLIDAIDEGLKNGRDDSKAFMRSILGLFRTDFPDGQSGEVIIESLSVTGESRDYQVYIDSNEPKLSGQIRQNISTVDVLNNENLARIDLRTTGNAKLTAEWFFGDSDPLVEVIGENRRNWEISIPLRPVGGATIDNRLGTSGNTFESIGFDNFNLFSDFNYIVDQSSPVEFISLQQPTKVRLTLSNEDSSKYVTVAIPKFNRLSSELRRSVNSNIEFCNILLIVNV